MNNAFLGIDISKKTFDAALLIDDVIKTKKFSNSASGCQKLIGWLDKNQANLVQACMEATGIYGENLAEFLYSHEIPVSVVNPARIKGFSQTELSRSKTDILDAKLIARFCKLIRPSLWKPTPKHNKLLQQWVRRLDDLIQIQIQEKNRLEAADDCVYAMIQSHVDYLESEIKALKKTIKKHIESNSELKIKSELLQSIPGIGEATIAQVLAFIGDINKFNSAKEVAAYVGLNPKQRQSGTSINGRTRLSKTGSSGLRKALYMPAVVAMKYNPIIINFSDRLTKMGKHKMSIVGAVMRKLIHIMYGIFKSGKKFNENILNCA